MALQQELHELNREPGCDYYIASSELDLNEFIPEAILTGHGDYPRWYRKMKAYLARSKKLGFADGSIKAPAKQADYKAWKNCNDLVLKWILKSLSPEIEIAESFKDYREAATAWEVLKKYSPGDLLIVSQFLVQIHTFKQDVDVDVPNFLAKINSFWSELDILRPPPKCACKRKCSCPALEKLKKQREQEILGVFLNGLNPRYHATRSRILRENPLPSPSKACSMIMEKHRPLEAESMINRRT